MFKDIQVVVLSDPGEDSTALLPFALGMAGAFGASLNVAATALQWDLLDPFLRTMDMDYVDRANRAASEQADNWVERALKEAGAAGVQCSAAAVCGSEFEVNSLLQQRSMLNDLNIIASAHDALSVGRTQLDTILFGSGRPTFVVPTFCQDYRAARIVVAWDGSARAARAVHDALPLLVSADHVSLASVAGEKDLSGTVPGSELAPHLARHGVKVEVHPLNVIDGDVAATLRNHAAHQRADLMVLGAWGHSRIREFVLGGVTRTMLGDSNLPLFMAI